MFCYWSQLDVWFEFVDSGSNYSDGSAASCSETLSVKSSGFSVTSVSFTPGGLILSLVMQYLCGLEGLEFLSLC